MSPTLGEQCIGLHAVYTNWLQRHASPKEMLEFYTEITSGAFSCHLRMDHTTYADTLLVEGNTKHVIEC